MEKPDVCVSKGCTNPVTHYTFLASADRLPFCCQHYDGVVELKNAIIEKQRAIIDQQRLEIIKREQEFGQYMSQIIKRLGLEPIR
jgi:hypothetical protein